MAVQAVQETALQHNVRGIINQLQLITYAAENQRVDVILGSIAFIEVMLDRIRSTV